MGTHTLYTTVVNTNGHSSIEQGPTALDGDLGRWLAGDFDFALRGDGRFLTLWSSTVWILLGFSFVGVHPALQFIVGYG